MTPARQIASADRITALLNPAIHYADYLFIFILFGGSYTSALDNALRRIGH